VAGRGIHWLANFFASRAATAEAFDYFLSIQPRAQSGMVPWIFLVWTTTDPFLSHIFRLPAFSDLEFQR